MKRTHTLIIGFGIMLCLFLLLTGCQKLEDDEGATGSSQLLKVKTRTAESAEVEYPLYLYAFDEGGNCAASQVLDEAGESPALSLKSGKYRIIALSGVSGGYSLPEKPDTQGKITLESNGASTALMMGKADVTIGDKQTTLNIVLKYAVSAISAKLSGIPEDVTAVNLMISPLHSSLHMNGEYGTESMQLEIPCKLNTDSIWSCDTIYAFPGIGDETLFNIQLTREDESRTTYAYTYSGTPEANRAFNISGNYTGDITIGGEFVISGWDSSIDVSFEFGSTLSDNEEKEEVNENTPEDNTGSGPQPGSIWKNAIVVKTEGDEVLLMSLEEWYASTSEVEYILQEQSGWHIPTYEEAQLLRSTFSGENRYALNETIWSHNGSLTGIDGEERYLCDKSGVYYSFVFAEGKTISKAGTKKLYYIRLLSREKI